MKSHVLKTGASVLLLVAGALPLRAGDGMDVALWDNCDSLDVLAPIFWQPTWNPTGFAPQRVGTLAIDPDEKTEGSGSLRWRATPGDIAQFLQPADQDRIYVMINRIHGQDWGDVREVRFDVKCSHPQRPPVRVQLVGYESDPELIILERGEITAGWKEIRWDISDLRLRNDDAFGPRMWFFRVACSVEEFLEGDALDLRIDNIRLVLPPARMATAPAGDSQVGALAVWPVHYAAIGSIHALPEPHWRGDLATFATPGETQPVSLYLRSDEGLRDVQVRLDGTLKSDEGREIPSDAVEIRAVASMKRWLDPGLHVPTETYLVEPDRMAVPAHTSQRYWVTVRVPDDAPAGVYRSGVVISAQGGELERLDLEVEVLPFLLAGEHDLAAFMYYSPHLMPERFRTAEHQRLWFEDMAAHEMTTVTGYFHPIGDIMAEARTGYLPLGATMEALAHVGLPRAGRPLVWIGAESYGDDMWRAILDAGAARQWPEFLFYMVDEPNPQRYPTVEAVMSRLAAFRESFPQYRVRTTTAMGPGAIRDIGHHYDVWICGAGAMRRDLAELARETGRELWAYECHFAPTNAELSRYYFGYWAWAAGVQGVAYWAYFDGAFYNRFGNLAGFEDVEADWLAWTNQFNFIFPSETGPIPTVGWEATRQGVIDHRYLVTLEQTIRQARQRGVDDDALAEAEAVLEDIRASIHVENLRQPAPPPRSEWPHADIFDRPSPEKHLAPEDYDAMRRRVAESIARIKGVES